MPKRDLPTAAPKSFHDVLGQFAGALKDVDTDKITRDIYRWRHQSPRCEYRESKIAELRDWIRSGTGD